MIAAAEKSSVENILKEISDVVSSIDDEQRVMDDLVRLTTTLLGVGTCSLVLIEPDGIEMRIRAGFGLSPEVVANFRQRVGDGITGFVAKSGKPLLIEDVETHPMFQRKNRSRYSTKSLLSVPLLYRQRTIGVLNVNNRNDGGVFTHSDELLLSVLANFMVITIEKAQMREKLHEQEKYEAELRVAREIQEHILPGALPARPKWELAARNVPARSVAGDFYDVIPLDESHTCVVLGDVCGKGLPAALYMVRVLSYYRVVAHVRHTAPEIMSFVNDLLASEWSERTFVTAAACVLDHNSGKVTFCSAGHPAPYRLSARTGEVEPVAVVHSLPLGIQAGVGFEAIELNAEPGDQFVLYTDGVTEAKNGREEMYCESRLCETMKGHRGSAQALLDRVVRSVEEFSGLALQSDDVTLVVIKRA